MLEWALDYADQGIAVFPLHTIISGECSCGISDCSSPGKHPIYARGVLAHGVKEATKDKELIKRWWSRWPEANIGVATGLVSGLFVVDVDGELGKKTMRKLQRRYGKLRTRIAQTGNGVHLFFRSGGREIKNHVGIVPGVDIRGCGGYVVAPPSKHVAGKRYVFSNELGLSDAPGWVIQMVTPKKAAAAHTQQRGRGEAEDPIKPEAINPIPDGQRNKKLSMIAIGLVKYQNYSESDLGNYMEEVNRTKCRPPVNDRELRGICRKALRYK